MFKTITSKIPRDKDFPQRQFDIDVLTRVLEGKLYDHLEYDFHQERKDIIGEYIPIRDRRPSVRYALCRIVVDDSISLLFSEGHFPAVECADETTRDTLADVIKSCMINQVMIEAATTGSVGSVVIFLRVLKNRLFFKVSSTEYLTPVWKADEPDTLERIIEQYKVKGAVLADQGYAIADDDLTVDFWFRREWCELAETWFVPWKVRSDAPTKPVVDASRTTTHQMGFVPAVWVKNLAGGDDIDGKATFPPEAIDTQIEIDYQLSQAGRGLKYSSDPTLLIKEPAMGGDGAMVKGGGNAIVVNENGDAKMLEINGSAAQAVLEYVRGLRELALESAHGNRANADKLSAAQSGRAMELMNQSLIWLADKLRISYGEGALLALLRMVVKASDKFELTIDGEKIKKLSQTAKLSLRWPAWYAPTYADKQTEATTLGILRDKQLLSQETAVKTIASSYDIADPADELRTIKAEPPPPGAEPPVKPAQLPLNQSDD